MSLEQIAALPRDASFDGQFALSASRHNFGRNVHRRMVDANPTEYMKKKRKAKRLVKVPIKIINVMEYLLSGIRTETKKWNKILMLGIFSRTSSGIKKAMKLIPMRMRINNLLILI